MLPVFAVCLWRPSLSLSLHGIMSVYLSVVLRSSLLSLWHALLFSLFRFTRCLTPCSSLLSRALILSRPIALPSLRTHTLFLSCHQVAVRHTAAEVDAPLGEAFYDYNNAGDIGNYCAPLGM